MKLHANWKTIAKRAWSIRLMALSGVLSGVEAILPLFANEFPRGLFAVLSITIITGAMVARVVAQQEMDDGD